jgi:NADPH:quinone reductase-like Zn-dependent oxidoreductase
MEAIGLNRAESMWRCGTYLEQPVFPARVGYEASGVVESLGQGVEGFEPGQAVNVIPAFSLNQFGTYAEEAILPAHAVVPRPSGLTPIEAAAVWMQYLTAYGALIDIGHLEAGDFVVVTAASSSVGLAAIQIARSVGATSIATTRTNAKKSALLEAGADHVIATQEQDIVAEILRLTNHQGARIVFDPVAGPWVEQLATVTKSQGILFQYGNLSGEPTPFPLFPALLKGLSMRGYILMEITADPQRLARAQTFIHRGLEGGQLKPIIAKMFPFDQIVEAHRYLESNEQIGKIVVTVP